MAELSCSLTNIVVMEATQGLQKASLKGSYILTDRMNFISPHWNLYVLH